MLTKLKSKLIKSIKNKKLNVFGLFFLMAFIILVFSKLSKNYTETLNFDVIYKNLPEESVLVNTEKPSIDIEISTYGFNLLANYFNNPTITIDFDKDTYIDDGTYIWLANRNNSNIAKQLGSALKIVSIHPDTLKIPFAKLEVKRVPVKLVSEVSYALGYDSLLGFITEPDSVNIIGSNKDISEINHIKTDLFDIKGIKEDVNLDINLIIPKNKTAVKLSQEKVKVSAKIQKFTEGVLDVPVIIKNLPPNIQVNYFPKALKVTYDVSLDDYKRVKPLDFKIVCDYSEAISTQKTYFTAKLVQAPSFVKRSKMKQNKIEYIIIK
ncbi:YbbR-like domain-containing protein [uncultured Psychroserpens sp.]|uniref:YbbR-like domain-containing protein n=1 Tax=uncultured Psychroserpens sp. TaxID=255436 RepID=UPI0026326CDC|nr:YbbR-like domain-containing protein [uncultured Psychroserpens sp.]